MIFLPFASLWSTDHTTWSRNRYEAYNFLEHSFASFRSLDPVCIFHKRSAPQIPNIARGMTTRDIRPGLPEHGIHTSGHTEQLRHFQRSQRQCHCSADLSYVILAMRLIQGEKKIKLSRRKIVRIDYLRYRLISFNLRCRESRFDSPKPTASAPSLLPSFAQRNCDI